jgi:minichromosome maintenance protein 10
MGIPSSDSEEDEDEETLQLKLKAIEAKLKLKKLQKAKTADGTDSRVTSSASNRSGRSSALEPPETFKPELQVPLSPARKQMQSLEPKSPARTLLGIDKGLTAQQVSLKRPRTTATNGSLSRSNSVRSAHEPRIKSFSERMAESRLSAQEQQTREQRIQESRSRGFGLQSSKEDDVFSSARTTSNLAGISRPSSNNEKAPPRKPATTAFLQRSSSLREKGTATSRPTLAHNKPEERSTTTVPKSLAPSLAPDPITTPSSDTIQPSSDLESSKSTACLESYSGIHLSKRQIDHTSLTRTLQGKELYPIPRLLHEVTGPHYESPDCESDYVVFGVICSKSTPRDHKGNPKSIDTSGRDEHARPKFMVFRLTDFKYEIDLFLFDTGFERWWKLKEGTLIAVLNPGIMPPRQKDTGAFSLKVTSSEDTILEIGKARDLGICKSIKVDGHQCTAWIDKRKTEVCEYHISLQVDKARANRMQFSTMTGGPGAGRGGGRGSGMRSSQHTRGNEHKNSKYVKNFGGLAKEGMYHDAYLHETMWITPKDMGLNAASLLDKEYTDQVMDKEARAKRKRDREKEEDLAKSLGLKGNGAGSEYLKHRTSLREQKDRRTTTAASSQTTDATRNTTWPRNPLDPPDAASLGLLGKTAQQVSLSPVKRKFASSSTRRNASAVPMGWSGAFKRGLIDRPDSPPPPPTTTAGVDSTQPNNVVPSPNKSSIRRARDEGSPRKKARLLLEGKGVRVPGRESLGKVPGDVFLESEDDDELEIV